MVVPLNILGGQVQYICRPKANFRSRPFTKRRIY